MFGGPIHRVVGTIVRAANLLKNRIVKAIHDRPFLSVCTTILRDPDPRVNPYAEKYPRSWYQSSNHSDAASPAISTELAYFDTKASNSGVISLSSKVISRAIDVDKGIPLAISLHISIPYAIDAVFGVTLGIVCECGYCGGNQNVRGVSQRGTHVNDPPTGIR